MSTPSSPPTVMTAALPGSVDAQSPIVVSSAHGDRRQRILDATVELAYVGGFDAVAMRTVADRSEVALGTLYRYFPSKLNLLAAVLLRSLQRLDAWLATRDLSHLTRSERVTHLFSQGSAAWEDSPRFAEALTRAYISADARKCPETRAVTALITRMIRDALCPAPGTITHAETEVAGVLADVCLAGGVGLVTNRRSKPEFDAGLERAVRLLVPDV